MKSTRAAVALVLVRHALGQDCLDLNKVDCDAAKACAWCEAGAVPSKCYKKEDAERLPPGVFECNLQSARAAVAGGRRHRNELLSRAETEALGITWRGNFSSSHDAMNA